MQAWQQGILLEIDFKYREGRGDDRQECKFQDPFL